MVSVADGDKEEMLPLVEKFYRLGYNIEATAGTGNFLKSHGIRTRIRRRSDHERDEILDSIRSGYVSYVINTRPVTAGWHDGDGMAIRRCAIENGVTLFTSLDTVRVLLEVLEEIAIGISTIDKGRIC